MCVNVRSKRAPNAPVFAKDVGAGRIYVTSYIRKKRRRWLPARAETDRGVARGWKRRGWKWEIWGLPGVRVYWAFEYAADYDCVHSPTPAVLRLSRIWIVLSSSIAMTVVRLLICRYVPWNQISTWDYLKIKFFFNLSGVFVMLLFRAILSELYNRNLITLLYATCLMPKIWEA